MDKLSVVRQMLPEPGQIRSTEDHFAPSNIALCKYWGKRDKELNLPVNPSLSISLGHLGTHTQLSPISFPVDEVWLNGNKLRSDTIFAQKISNFIDLFRQDLNVRFKVDTRNNIPTAAGLASSASGFAALTLALNEAFDLQLERPALSMLARLGSGSACRSVYSGFVEWHMGHREDGLDSHAHPIDISWPGFAVGLIKVDESTKSVGSRSGMQHTIDTSHLYQAWPAQANADLSKIHAALAKKDFTALGSTAEHNSLSMHATMISSWPPLLYWQPRSVAVMQEVWLMRKQGIEIYSTLDAGPNVKLLFLASDLNTVLTSFPDMEVVLPFGT